MRNNIAIGAAVVLFSLFTVRYALGIPAPATLDAVNHAHVWRALDWIGLAATAASLALLLYARQASPTKLSQASAVPPRATGRFRMGRPNPMTTLADRATFDAMSTTHLLHGQPCAVLLVGIDGFKRINSELGYAFGDGLLQQVGDRLRALMADSNAVAHLFSDEFAVLVAGMPATGEAAAVALRLLRGFDSPFSHNGESLTVSISIGIAETPRHGHDTATLMQAATHALRAAKIAGRGIWRTYDDSMQDSESALRKALPGAILDDEIVPDHQPIIDLATGQVTGLEVLARWNHPTRGLLLPGSFIDIAEQEGQLSGITRSLMRQVGAAAIRWPEHLFFAFNIAPNQLRDVLGYYETVVTERPLYRLSPRRMEVELMETSLIKDFEATREVVRLLRSHGARVSLADFGAGQGNFHHLQGIAFDGIKIGKEFVLDMLTEPGAEFCVHCISDVGKQLGIDVTAEGVSTPEILTRVQALGCRFAQGSLFSMPIAADAVPDVLKRLAAASTAPNTVRLLTPIRHRTPPTLTVAA